MSTPFANAQPQLYIQRLKSAFGVKTDEELAARIGLSKQAIGNWRARGKIPTKIQTRMFDEYGIRYSDWDYNFAEPTGDIIYAVSLYVYERLIFQKENLTVNTRRTIGRLFPQIIRAVSARMDGISGDGQSAETLIALFLTYIDSGQFREIEDLISEFEEE